MELRAPGAISPGFHLILRFMPTAMNDVAVRIAGLAKRYGRQRVLAGVDLEVRSG